MNENELIEAFIQHLKITGEPELRIESWPDKSNSTSPDIDAIAGPYAIEHTSIDTLPYQRRDSARFNIVVGNLESEFRDTLDFRLVVTFDYSSVARRQDWKAINSAIRDWVSKGTLDLPDGTHKLENLPGIPFLLHVTKGGMPGSGLFFSRFTIEDSTLHSRLQDQLVRKGQKLSPYRANGKTTILLLENNDIALMNSVKMIFALKKAFPSKLPPSIDRLWFADTSIGEEVYFEDYTDHLVSV